MAAPLPLSAEMVAAILAFLEQQPHGQIILDVRAGHIEQARLVAIIRRQRGSKLLEYRATDALAAVGAG